MKNKKINLSLIVVVVLTSIIFLTSFTSSPDQDIIGLWTSEEDSDWKLEFKTDGKCYWYYSGEDTEVFNYSISSTSLQCGYQVEGGSNNYYLKFLGTEDVEEYCYEILGVDNESLSIMSIGLNTKKFVFVK